ncbi:MAG: DUF1572 family protein [Planctomycetota bacterium]
MTISDLFIAASIARLREEYLPRIRASVDLLDAEGLWWRPKEWTNSVGNLLLHLDGNVRQWMVSGLGGERDLRDRSEEFRARESERSAGELLEGLAATVDEACAVIEPFDEARLAASFQIQGTATTGIEAIYHVVEHFGWHVGQIVLLTKMASARGQELSFYDDEALDGLRND